MKAFNEWIQGRDSINEGIQRMRSKKGFNEGGSEARKHFFKQDKNPFRSDNVWKQQINIPSE